MENPNSWTLLHHDVSAALSKAIEQKLTCNQRGELLVAVFMSHGISTNIYDIHAHYCTHDPSKPGLSIVSHLVSRIAK